VTRGYPPPMRILVTGGAGYVGSVSVEALVEAGHEVVVLDNLSTGRRSADLLGAELVEGTYTDRPFMTSLLRDRKTEAVLHCGARSLVGESIRDPALYFRENLGGGVALLEAMRDVGVGRLVISSTAAVYGVPESSPIDEDASLRPINPYGESKRGLEAAAGWFARAYGLRAASLRYFNVAGASERNGEVHEPETHLIPNVLTAAAGGAPLTVFGADYPTRDGTAVRDYVHVVDLADAHRIALEATAPGDPRLDGHDGHLVANLGSGEGFSVREVLDAAERVIGHPVPHTIGARREGDPPTLVASIDRARDVLGWAPGRSSLEEMIRSAWTWRQAHQG
jgi:UDP-glucose 4-epimerase